MQRCEDEFTGDLNKHGPAKRGREGQYILVGCSAAGPLSTMYMFDYTAFVCPAEDKENHSPKMSKSQKTTKGTKGNLPIVC